MRSGETADGGFDERVGEALGAGSDGNFDGSATIGRVLPGPVPAEIASTDGKLVYLFLATAGECAATDLVERLGMQRITLFGVLSALEGRGLVERVDGGTYRVAS